MQMFGWRIGKLVSCMALALAGALPAAGWAAGATQFTPNGGAFPPENDVACSHEPDAACLIDLALAAAAAAGSEQQFRARSLAASILLDMGDDPAALELLRLALAKSAGESPPEYSLESLVDIAILQHRAGDDEAAHRTLETAAELAGDTVPDGFEAVRRLASAQIAIGDEAGAIATVKRAVRLPACKMPPKARLPLLVEAARWYIEIGHLPELSDIALRIHVSLVRAGGRFAYSTGDGKVVAAIASELLDTGKSDTAADFLGLSEAPDAAAPGLSAIEELPSDTSWGILATFTTSAVRWIDRSKNIADRIDSLQRAARIFDRISQRETAADLRQEALQLALAIDDAPTRMDVLLSMARYDWSVGRKAEAQAMLIMAIGTARDVRADVHGSRLEKLVQTAIELRQIDLLRAVLRLHAVAVGKIPSPGGRLIGEFRIAGLQAKAGMAVDAGESLMDGFRLARQLSEPASFDKVGFLFLALAIAHAGDGAGALQALQMSEGTFLYDANIIAEVAAEIAIDRWQAGKRELALRAADLADSAFDAAAQGASLESSLEISFARSITGDTQAAIEGLRRAAKIAIAIDEPTDRAAALLRVAQFAAAVQSHHSDPRQLGLEGWKMLGE